MIEEAVIAIVETFVAALIVKAPSLVVAPAVPLKVIFPVPAVRVRPPGPSIVLEKVMSPAPLAVFNAAALLKTTGPAKEIASFVVVIDPAIWADPAPL